MIARDIMTHKVYTIYPEASVQEVAQLLSRKSISGVPVIDKDGKIIGIVTEADIIGKVNREGLRVADIMSSEIIVVDEETPVGEIAMLLTERKIKRVPVIRNGKFGGHCLSSRHCPCCRTRAPDHQALVTTPHGSRAGGFWNDSAVSSHGTRSVHAHQRAVAQNN